MQGFLVQATSQWGQTFNELRSGRLHHGVCQVLFNIVEVEFVAKIAEEKGVETDDFLASGGLTVCESALGVGNTENLQFTPKAISIVKSPLTDKPLTKLAERMLLALLSVSLVVVPPLGEDGVAREKVICRNKVQRMSLLLATFQAASDLKGLKELFERLPLTNAFQNTIKNFLRANGQGESERVERRDGLLQREVVVQVAPEARRSCR